MPFNGCGYRSSNPPKSAFSKGGLREIIIPHSELKQVFQFLVLFGHLSVLNADIPSSIHRNERPLVVRKLPRRAPAAHHNLAYRERRYTGSSYVPLVL